MSERKVGDWMAMVDVNIKGVLNAMAAACRNLSPRSMGTLS